MLTLPTYGIARSVNVHNVRIDVLCDWIEASLLFADGKISSPDIVDVLLEEQIYDSADMASARVEDAWTEVRRRMASLGSSAPFKLEDRRIVRKVKWQNVSAYSFCVLISYARWNRTWGTALGPDYTEQGQLFEELVQASVQSLLLGWNILLTGWSKAHVANLNSIVNDVAECLSDPRGNVERWTNAKAKDAGLDLVAVRQFGDGRGGMPTLMIQCASGGNWKEKQATPDLDWWGKLIDFSSRPTRAFAIPFALHHEDFRFCCLRVKGPVFDRYRLLAASSVNSKWIPRNLSRRLVKWTKSKSSSLPRQ